MFLAAPVQAWTAVGPEKLATQRSCLCPQSPRGLGPIKAPSIATLLRRVQSRGDQLFLPYLWPRTTLTEVRAVGRGQQNPRLSAGNPTNPGPTRDGRLLFCTKGSNSLQGPPLIRGHRSGSWTRCLAKRKRNTEWPFPPTPPPLIWQAVWLT